MRASGRAAARSRRQGQAADRDARRHRRVAPPRRPSDLDDVRRFFHELSPESRRRRFFAPGEPPASVSATSATRRIPAKRLTLLAVRQVAEQPRLIAVGSYLKTSARSAEAAFAVGDRFQGAGIGTALLERLAAIAVGKRLHAVRGDALADNVAMLEVFRDSGFRSPIEDRPAAWSTSSCTLERSDEASRPPKRAAPRRPPRRSGRCSSRARSRSSARRAMPASIGRRVLDALVDRRIRGPDLSGQPRRVRDRRPAACTRRRAICRPASTSPSSRCRGRAVLAVVDDCAAAGVNRSSSSRPASPKRAPKGARSSTALVERVRGYGMRMVGPNCMGLLNASPRVRLNASFSPICPAGRHVALVVAERRARHRDPRGSRPSAASACRRSSASATRPTCRATICSSTGRTTRRRASSCSTSSRSATRAASRGWRAASAATKPIVAREGGPHRGRIAGGRQPHRGARGERHGGRRALPAVRRHPRRHDRRDVRHRRVPRRAAAAGRTRVAIVTNAGGPGILAVDACEAAGLTVVVVLGRDARTRLARVPARRGERRQSRRHGRVGRAGRVSAGDRGRCSPTPTRTR